MIPEVENIIVGMDGGKLADAAIQAALHLGSTLDARVHVIHAINLGDVHSWFENDAQKAERLADLQVHTRKLLLLR